MIRSKFKLDKKYYKEDLSQWVKSVSNGRRYEPYISAVLLVLGVFFLYQYQLTVFSVFCLCAGTFEGCSHFIWRAKWLGARKKDKQYNQYIELEMDSGNIIQTSAEPENSIVKPIVRIIEAPKGFFVYLEQQQRIYIPKNSLSPLGVQFKLEFRDELEDHDKR
ncbi:MAG: hypothetical protein KUG78_12005 [Kangiellaceae bacterium]|nr:hypothetical protein [Kangiellaceae bacterium]